MDGEKFIRQMVEVSLLLLTYQVKVLLGLSGMNWVGQTLFRDWALLRLIGDTPAQLRDGFCRRGKTDKQKPLHKNVLADAVEKLTADELSYLVNESMRRLAGQGVLAESQGRFALDATELETTARFKDCGAKTGTERKWSRKEKKPVDIEKTVPGFKRLALYDVQLPIVVAAKVVKLQAPESQFTRELLRQGVSNLGPGVIRVLLIDRGFLDGLSLWQIKHDEGVDFVVPAKGGMHVKTDARAFLKETPDGQLVIAAERLGQGSTQAGHVKLIGIAGLTTYDQYGDDAHQQRANRADFEGNPLKALVVTGFEHPVYPPDQAKVFLTSLPVTDALTVLDEYGLRSLIENTRVRELRQGWFIGRFPKKTAEAVRGHVFLTLTIFNWTDALRTESGQQLAQRGIRRQRRQWTDVHHVIVLAGDPYAIFDVEEIFILLGRPPEICWRVNPANIYRTYAADGLRQPV